MPLYSYRCMACNHEEDRFATIAMRNSQVCYCGENLSRTYTSSAVIDDSIPGGFVQENFGSKPETFYSKRDMSRRAKELGLQPFVRHIGEDGTDKSSKTSRWV